MLHIHLNLHAFELETCRNIVPTLYFSTNCSINQFAITKNWWKEGIVYEKVPFVSTPLESYHSIKKVRRKLAPHRFSLRLEHETMGIINSISCRRRKWGRQRTRIAWRTS